MDIKKFVAQYHNHPVLFIGTGFSLRYLTNSYTWDNLLKKIALDIFESEESYYDIKAKYISDKNCDYSAVAEELEKNFNEIANSQRRGKFKDINDIYYSNLRSNIKLSRFKLYISSLLKESKPKKTPQLNEELKILSRAKKNISSIITTNYDQLIEQLFEFTPIIGNDIVLTNPYGSIYKVHGCLTNSDSIIITSSDYEKFNKKYDFVKAQLLSLFIHNPIIFIGYSISDDNIKNILKTIFSNISTNDQIAQKIRSNFLLVEHEKNSSSREVIEHDIDLPINDESTTIRINKIKTDNFLNIYKELAELTLPISAMDVKKVQQILKKIINGESSELKVKFANDVDEIENKDMVIAIGTENSIKINEVIKVVKAIYFIQNYFEIIDNQETVYIETINNEQLYIDDKAYFPIFGFYNISKNLVKYEEYAKNQKNKLKKAYNRITEKIARRDLSTNQFQTIKTVMEDKNISKTYKPLLIFYLIYNKIISIEELKDYLIANPNDFNTNYRMLLCLYDFMKYSSNTTL